MAIESCPLDPNPEPSAPHSLIVLTPYPNSDDSKGETLTTGIVTVDEAASLRSPSLSCDPDSPCITLVLLVLWLVLGLFP